MTDYEPRWDINLAEGKQAEMFVLDVGRMLADRSGEIEVKRDFRFLGRRGLDQEPTQRFYIERECFARGKWRPSGIATTKSKLWAISFGDYTGLIVLDTEWIRRAVALAEKRKGTAASESDGSHPTRGTCIYLLDLIKTRKS